MSDATWRLTYLILLRVFFSYTQSIADTTKTNTMVELARSEPFNDDVCHSLPMAWESKMGVFDARLDFCRNSAS